MHPRFFPSSHNSHTRPTHSKGYERIKFDSLFIGCPDEAGFGEECGRCRLPPPQIPLESRYHEIRYYNSNSKIARDRYRLALVSDPDETGNVFRLMIPITEIAEAHLHEVEGVRRYTIIFTAYPNRQLSAIEFIRDLGPGQRYNPTSKAQMLARHADVFHHRIITIIS